MSVTILLCDRDFAALSQMRAEFLRCGCNVILTSHSGDVAKLCQRHEPDMIVVDGASGSLEVLTWLRHFDDLTPVIVVSEELSQGLVTDNYLSGADMVLDKNPREVANQLSRLLN